MTHPLFSSSLLAPLFSSAPMREILTDTARLQRMLDVEQALAEVEGALGIIPASAVRPIAAACRAELFDVEAIGAEASAAGNVAIPLVKALTQRVAKQDAKAAGFVHWGATSQDIIDTALVLELGAVIDALLVDIERAISGFAKLAEENRKTIGVARTLLQQALPTPFGLKFAGYAAALARTRTRLRRAREESLVLQFGGAVGTLAAFGDRGLEVAEKLAEALGLKLPDAPWHSHRDRLGDVAAAFAILAGTCGKIARDTALLAQTEVAEIHERAAPGRGGSSTMPHKRNPVAAATALAAATIAPHLAATLLGAQMQEHERGVGNWAAEWPSFPALALTVSGALAAIVDIAEGAEIDRERVRANVEMTRGQIMTEAVSMALARKLGRESAYKLIEKASHKAHATNVHLKDILAADPAVAAQLSKEDLDRLLNPENYQGVAQALIDQLLSSAGLRRP